MNKVIYFASDSLLPWQEIEGILSQVYPGTWHRHWHDKKTIVLTIDASFLNVLPSFLSVIHETMTLNLSTLITFKEDALGAWAIAWLRDHRVLTMTTMGDFLFQQLRLTQSSFVPLVQTWIRELDRDLRLTARAYLHHNLKVTHAANALFLHRNTFQYRLQKFMSMTGMDLKDFDQAFFFKLADQL